MTKWINARISAVGKDQAAGASTHPQVPGYQRTKARWGREQLRKNLSQVWSSLGRGKRREKRGEIQERHRDAQTAAHHRAGCE